MTEGVFKNRFMQGNKFFKEYESEDVESLDDVDLTVDSDDYIEQLELSDTVRRALLTLTPREERVIRERFLNDKTLVEVCQLLNVGAERIRQIEAKALRKLKHPSRSGQMREFLAA